MEGKNVDNTLSNENSSEESKEIKVENECILLTPEGCQVLKNINTDYNAIEFRVDMFLNNLCSKWCDHEYVGNKLTKFYVGERVPESQYESNEILYSNIDYYKECIKQATGLMRML